MSHTSTELRRRRTLSIAATVLSLGIVAAACGGDSTDEPVAAAADTESISSTDSEPSSELPPFGLLEPEEAAALADDDTITVIDVRTPEEYAEGHLEGATLIDFYDAGFAEELAALDPDETYLIYCRSGNRSGQTATMMADLGFERVFDLDGGILAWNAAGGSLAR